MTANHRLLRVLMTMAFGGALLPLAAHAQSAQLPAPTPLLPSAAPATTRPATVGGRLFIHAVQKTANAPAPASDLVTIHFQGAGQKINPVPMRLDERGTAELTGIPLTRTPLVPIIVVQHAGLSYQAVGDPMDLSHPDQKLGVAVYEVTERLPEWCMPRRQVMLSRVPEGLRVTEVVAVHNSTDRAWIGSPDAAGQRPTVAMPLPQGARDLQFDGGFSPELTRFDGTMLRHNAPLSPGVTQYQVSYTLPSVGTQMVVPITAPTTVHELNVLLADDGSPVSATGLETVSVTESQGQKARQFTAKELKPGQTVSITVATAAPPAVAAGSEPSVLPKVIAGATLVGLLLIASVVMFLRSTRPAKTSGCCGMCEEHH